MYVPVFRHTEIQLGNAAQFGLALYGGRRSSPGPCRAPSELMIPDNCTILQASRRNGTKFRSRPHQNANANPSALDFAWRISRSTGTIRTGTCTLARDLDLDLCIVSRIVRSMCMLHQLVPTCQRQPFDPESRYPWFDWYYRYSYQSGMHTVRVVFSI